MRKTSYADVINVFLLKVKAYSLPQLDDREDIILSYLYSACSRFVECRSDLTDVDDENKTFNILLKRIEIDILAELMISEWLNPIVLNEEAMKNVLSTVDYSIHSPANLLGQLRDTYEMIKKQSRKDINRYTFQYPKPKDGEVV